MVVKRLLILSYYYEPDLSACSFRTTALVRHLTEKYPELEIDILTTLPSRYSSYRPTDVSSIEQSNVHVHRIAVPEFNVGLKGELISGLYYYRQVMKFTKGKHYDLVYGTSSKLATATLAKRIASQTSARVFLDIRDLFVENIRDMFNPMLSRMLLPTFKLVEKYTLSNVDRVNIVSEGFRQHIERYVDSNKISVFTNGIDCSFIPLDKPQYHRPKGTTIRLVYAGNIGRAQALEKIIPKLAKRLKNNIEITIIGDGRKNAKLISVLQSAKLTNVIVHPPVPRDELLNYYSHADVLFLHLDSCACLEHVIPSKIFEYAATGLPLLCGVQGYTKQFIEQNVSNAKVFIPNDVEHCITQLKSLNLKQITRTDFIQQFSRNNIMNGMTKEIGRLLYVAENHE
ncbi:glycosyltransferase WbuB [Vibrio parahaemolyticus]|uniref:glycosyltransferase family 4 protein n=1 Tax=Vibrio parahaemolyticus TaxID=670 RepID=UPI00111FA7B3|nr:glycosyltransferase family 4 protein [Vibrio parahaemolyticus]TOM22495.1 glycosyltransferase WbuB [Vibrio parahaemolyticus]HCG7066416.1 glycosyltransferase family 4 protein [Vibrio parahaemolyticus]HCH2795880.1 glycosyltransferase family 4 protein [Vibrio parahaemolyticus]